MDGGLLASREPLVTALDRLRFQHKAHLSGFSPQGQVVWGVRCPASNSSKSQAPDGLGRARLKVEGGHCVWAGRLGFTSPKTQTGNCRVLVVAFIFFFF